MGQYIDYSLANKMFNKYIHVSKLPALNHENKIRDMSLAEKRKRIILGRHRLKCVHLSFDTTIVGNEQKGFFPIYFYYYFAYEYLNFFKRILRKNEVIIW
jgi:hypothetical protein